jgi:hypothetical protein
MENQDFLDDEDVRKIKNEVINGDEFQNIQQEIRNLKDSIAERRRGNGITDILKPKQAFNNTSKKTLKKYGDLPIVALNIYRTPIPSAIDYVLNLISLGKWKAGKKKYGFDKFFHLALVATVKDANNLKYIIIEKNEVVNISTSYQTNDNTEVMPVYELKNANLSINDMVLKTLKSL